MRTLAQSLPWVVQFLIIMLITDFAQYWLHRAFHRVPALWRFHAVHHSARTMDWIAGARMHFLEIIILRAVTATPALLIGFDEFAIQAYALFVYVYSTFIHSNVGTSFGFLEKILVAPRFHHWHHGVERRGGGREFRHPLPVPRQTVRHISSAGRKMAERLRRAGPSGAEGVLEAASVSVPALTA